MAKRGASQEPVSGAAKVSTRKEAWRYRYPTATDAGMFECLDSTYSADDLKADLLAIPGVVEVVPHRKGDKSSHNNVSKGHAQQQNWEVLCDGQKKYFEFETTGSKHYKKDGKHLGRSVCFKTAPAGMEIEAWRLLAHLAEKHAKFPEQFEEWHQDVQNIYIFQVSLPTSTHDAPTPGSALCREAPKWLLPAQ